MLVVGDEATQQHLPFEERRAQTDLLQRRFPLLILSVFDLPKCQNDAVEVGLRDFVTREMPVVTTVVRLSVISGEISAAAARLINARTAVGLTK